MKVAIVIGTRPEIIRLSSVIRYLRHSSTFDVTLIHTGQNYDYELNEIFFEDLELGKPDIFLDSVGKNSMATVGNVISKSFDVFSEIEPDCCLVLGDTNSCLAAVAAKRLRIPVFHMEAGNRCFDSRVPEETNRKIVDHTSDINLTYSAIAREYLLREGLKPEFVICTGSPMQEVLSEIKQKAAESKILETLGLTTKQFFLVSFHRDENVSSVNRLTNLAEALNKLKIRYGFDVVFSTHPRTLKALNGLSPELTKELMILKPFSFSDYVALQEGAYVVLSDSGTVSEEADILSLKAVNLREAHERPEAMEEAVVPMSGLAVERILECVEEVGRQEKPARRVKDYDVNDVSRKVASILLSYTDMVKQKVYFDE